MKLSNRDKKLLLILGIILVVAVPLLFPFRSLLEKGNEFNTKLLDSINRKSKLEELKVNEQSYLDSIAEMKELEGKIIDEFDEGLNQENIIMFAHNSEIKYPFYITDMAFSDTTETVLREEQVVDGETEAGLKFVARQTAVGFNIAYANLKAFLSDIINHEDHMGFAKLELEYEDGTGILVGIYTLNQYAFISDRPYEDAGIPALERGTDSLFGHFIEDPIIDEAVNGPDEEEGEAEAEE